MKSITAKCGCIFQQDDNGNIIFDLSVEKIRFDCPLTWKLLADGKTKGIFQLESHLGKHFCKQLKPENIEQLSALLALIRPGSLEALIDGKSMTHHYIHRKNCQEPTTYFHDAIKPALEATYGVLTYQEQSMQIARDIAGFDLQSADILRRAIGKKKPEIMAELKEQFIDGCVKIGKVTKEEATTIFEWIEKSQRYSFNKCVAHNTRLLRRNGRNLTVEEMYLIRHDGKYATSSNMLHLYHLWDLFGNYGKGFSMTENGLVQRNIILDITDEGVQQTWKLILENFSSIEVTWNHRFPTDQGIKEITDFDGSEKLYCRTPTNKTVLVGIKSIGNSQIQRVYNIEMAAPHHNFITDANIVTCNSHAVSYAYNAYLTAYCKAHFKHEFYTSYLYYAKSKPKFQEEVAALIEDAKSNGVTIAKPSLNQLNAHFKLNDGQIYFGITDIKSVGNKVFEKILKSIHNGKRYLQAEFQDQWEFSTWSWMEVLLLLLRHTNTKAVESLILSGALDYLGLQREILLHQYRIFMKLKDREQLWIQNYLFKSANRKETNLKECLDALILAPTGKNGGIYQKRRIPYVASLAKSYLDPGYEVKDLVRKKSFDEESLLGVSITTHKIDQYDTSGANCTCIDFLQGNHPKIVILSVFIKNCREYICTKGNNKGRAMAFLNVSDRTCTLENVAAFSDVYDTFKYKLESGNSVLLIGKKSQAKDMFIIENVLDMQLKNER
jgi:DNA polymerase-3 subunit alpha